jgi:hypothetical protein
MIAPTVCYATVKQEAQMVTTQSTPSVLTRKLDAHENLLWWGRPARGMLLRRADLLLVPFSLLWGGFAFWGAWKTAVSDWSWAAAVVFIPFAVIGVYLIVGRFIHDAWRRAGTYYGITDHRILIVEPSSMKSMDLGQLGQMRMNESVDRSGSLVFGPETGLLDSSQGWSVWTGRPVTPTFERIARVADVYALIRRAQSQTVPR